MAYFVYFLKGPGGAIKVGWCQNPAARLTELQIASPDRIEYLGLLSVPTKRVALDEERNIHERFRPWHIRGEWFAPPEKELQRQLRGTETYESPRGAISRGRISEARLDPDRHPRSSIRWSEIEYPEWMDDVDRRNLRRMYRTPGALRAAVQRVLKKRGIRKARRPAPPS